MLTMIYRVVAKPGKSEEFRKVALECEKVAHSSPDCLSYTFYESLNNPHEFIVYYKFTNKEAQDRHILKLQSVLGPAKNGRDLPTKFTDLLASEEIVYFYPGVKAKSHHP